MPGRAPQNFKNHTRLVLPFHVGVFGILLVNFAATIKTAAASLDAGHVLQCAVALALIVGFFYARAFAIAVQDRVIRVEMHLRLAALAPDVMARFDEFTVRQLVALRFAGDLELPGLARKTLLGEFPTSKAIKQEIRDWKPDYWRA